MYIDELCRSGEFRFSPNQVQLRGFLNKSESVCGPAFGQARVHINSRAFVSLGGRVWARFGAPKLGNDE